MSDQSISIVPRQSFYLNNKNKAKEILYWLVSLDIVKPILTNCILGLGTGYAISKGAKDVVKDSSKLPYKFIANGLELVTSSQVFDTGQYDIVDLVCPNCNEHVSGEVLSFIENWYENLCIDPICPFCFLAADINKYTFIPRWGFSDLGFKFWNWPDFTDQFTIELEHKLHCEVSVVHQLL